MAKRANCSCPDICPAVRSEEPPDEWSNTLENLTSFLSASASLVQDLRQTIQGTEAFNVAPPEEPAVQKEAVQKDAKDTCICAPAPCTRTPRPPGDQKTPQENAKDCICAPAPCTRTPRPPGDEKTPQKNAKDCICDPAPCSRKAIGDVKCQTPSTSTIVLEPQYEEIHEEVQEPKEEPKKPPKAKVSKKQKFEQYTKEKTEKLSTLKQSITVAQKNLLDVQEQLRQLERLFQDYTSANTPEGQVNPAALFKEIMKPQSVPYIKPSPPAPSCLCESCMDSTIRAARTPSKPEQRPGKKTAVPENVSVLSAVPLNEPFI